MSINIYSIGSDKNKTFFAELEKDFFDTGRYGDISLRGDGSTEKEAQEMLLSLLDDAIAFLKDQRSIVAPLQPAAPVPGAETKEESE